MGFQRADFGSLVQVLYGIEEGIARGLWANSSPLDSKGKNQGPCPKSLEIGAIGTWSHRFSRPPQTHRQSADIPYQMVQQAYYGPVAPYRPAGPPYLHPPLQPVYATQVPERPSIQYHQQYRAPPSPRLARQFTQLEMPLSRAFQRLVEGGLIAPLPPKPPSHPTPLGFRTDLHYAYHQRAGHDIDSCVMLRHAIQVLINQGLVDLGCPVVTTNPLPTHDARVVPPPTSGVHSIEFSGDKIFMMGWDGEAPQSISLYTNSYLSGYTSSQQIPRPFRLIPNEVPKHTSISPVYLQHVPTMTPFILFPKEYGPIHRDVQIVTHSGRVA